MVKNKNKKILDENTTSKVDLGHTKNKNKISKNNLMNDMKIDVDSISGESKIDNISRNEQFKKEEKKIEKDYYISENKHYGVQNKDFDHSQIEYENKRGGDLEKDIGGHNFDFENHDEYGSIPNDYHYTDLQNYNKNENVELNNIEDNRFDFNNENLIHYKKYERNDENRLYIHQDNSKRFHHNNEQIYNKAYPNNEISDQNLFTYGNKNYIYDADSGLGLDNHIIGSYKQFFGEDFQPENHYFEEKHQNDMCNSSASIFTNPKVAEEFNRVRNGYRNVPCINQGNNFGIDDQYRNKSNDIFNNNGLKSYDDFMNAQNLEKKENVIMISPMDVFGNSHMNNTPKAGRPKKTGKRLELKSIPINKQMFENRSEELDYNGNINIPIKEDDHCANDLNNSTAGKSNNVQLNPSKNNDTEKLNDKFENGDKIHGQSSNSFKKNVDDDYGFTSIKNKEKNMLELNLKNDIGIKIPNSSSNNVEMENEKKLNQEKITKKRGRKPKNINFDQVTPKISLKSQEINQKSDNEVLEDNTEKIKFQHWDINKSKGKNSSSKDSLFKIYLPESCFSTEKNVIPLPDDKFSYDALSSNFFIKPKNAIYEKLNFNVGAYTKKEFDRAKLTLQKENICENNANFINSYSSKNLAEKNNVSPIKNPHIENDIYLRASKIQKIGKTNLKKSTIYRKNENVNSTNERNCNNVYKNTENINIWDGLALEEDVYSNPLVFFNDNISPSKSKKKTKATEDGKTKFTKKPNNAQKSRVSRQKNLYENKENNEEVNSIKKRKRGNEEYNVKDDLEIYEPARGSKQNKTADGNCVKNGQCDIDNQFNTNFLSNFGNDHNNTYKNQINVNDTNKNYYLSNTFPTKNYSTDIYGEKSDFVDTYSTFSAKNINSFYNNYHNNYNISMYPKQENFISLAKSPRYFHDQYDDLKKSNTYSINNYENNEFKRRYNENLKYLQPDEYNNRNYHEKLNYPISDVPKNNFNNIEIDYSMPIDSTKHSLTSNTTLPREYTTKSNRGFYLSKNIDSKTSIPIRKNYNMGANTPKKSTSYNSDKNVASIFPKYKGDVDLDKTYRHCLQNSDVNKGLYTDKYINRSSSIFHNDKTITPGLNMNQEIGNIKTKKKASKKQKKVVDLEKDINLKENNDKNNKNSKRNHEVNNEGFVNGASDTNGLEQKKSSSNRSSKDITNIAGYYDQKEIIENYRRINAKNYNRSISKGIVDERKQPYNIDRKEGRSFNNSLVQIDTRFFNRRYVNFVNINYTHKLMRTSTVEEFKDTILTFNQIVFIDYSELYYEDMQNQSNIVNNQFEEKNNINIINEENDIKSQEKHQLTKNSTPMKLKNSNGKKGVFFYLRDMFYISINQGGFVKESTQIELTRMLGYNYEKYKELYILFILPFEQFFYRKSVIVIFERKKDHLINIKHDNQNSNKDTNCMTDFNNSHIYNRGKNENSKMSNEKNIVKHEYTEKQNNQEYKRSKYKKNAQGKKNLCSLTAQKENNCDFFGGFSAEKFEKNVQKEKKIYKKNKLCLINAKDVDDFKSNNIDYANFEYIRCSIGSRKGENFSQYEKTMHKYDRNIQKMFKTGIAYIDIEEDCIIHSFHFGDLKDVCFALNTCKYSNNSKKIIEAVAKLYFLIADADKSRKINAKAEESKLAWIDDKSYHNNIFDTVNKKRSINVDKLIRKNKNNSRIPIKEIINDYISPKQNLKKIKTMENNTIIAAKEKIDENSNIMNKVYKDCLLTGITKLTTNKDFKNNLQNDSCLYRQIESCSNRFINIPKELLFLLKEQCLDIITIYISTFSLKNNDQATEAHKIYRDRRKRQAFEFIDYYLFNKILQTLIESNNYAFEYNYDKTIMRKFCSKTIDVNIYKHGSKMNSNGVTIDFIDIYPNPYNKKSKNNTLLIPNTKLFIDNDILSMKNSNDANKLKYNSYVCDYFRCVSPFDRILFLAGKLFFLIKITKNLMKTICKELKNKTKLIFDILPIIVKLNLDKQQKKKIIYLGINKLVNIQENILN